jgi:hypothetical protein
MGELVKILGKFFSRDFLYILGGASVLFSVLYAFDKNIAGAYPVEIKIFVVGVCYVLGYLIQDVLSLTPLITTSQPKPKSFLKWIYKRFTKKNWERIHEVDYAITRIELTKKYQVKDLEDLERLISLKHIGTTMGSCWLVSGLILIVKGIYSKIIHTDLFGFIVLALGVLLIILGWLKGMQQYQLLYRLTSADTKK